MKQLLFLCLALTIIIIIGSQTIVAHPTQAFSPSEGFSVATPNFEVSFDQSQYFLVQPFQRLVKIWVEVKNKGNEADKINFFLPANVPKGWNVHGGGYIYLQPGESGYHEVVNAWPTGMRGSANTRLNISMTSEVNPASTTSATINISYVDLSLKDAPMSAMVINVYDAATNSPITDASVYYRISSQSEFITSVGGGQFEAHVPSYDSLSEFAEEYGVSWSGYSIEVHAAGYQSYYEDGLKPGENTGLTRDVHLISLAESASFQAAWMENLEYPGVWRVVTSENWQYLAAAMGKHGDSGDVRGPTKVHFFDSTKGLLWSYPVGGHVGGIDINQDGSLVAAGSHDGKIHVINRSGKLVWKYDAGNTELREVKFSSTGAYIGAETMPIKIFNAASGKIAWEFHDPVKPWWRGITFSKGDKYVVYAGGNSVMLLDIENRKLVWHKEIAGVPYDVMLTPDLSQIVVADKGDNLWSYDGQGNLLWRHSDLTVLTDADMSQDGSRIVALSHDGAVRMYNGEGKLLWKRTVGSGGHNGIDMTADGKYVTVGGGTMESPYEVFLLDKDGNTLWKHSQPGPVSTSDHPYTISTMSVAISDDASYIVAGYGTNNPGVQLFQSKISSEVERKAMEEMKEKATEEVETEKEAIPLPKRALFVYAGAGVLTIAIVVLLIIIWKRYKSSIKNKK